MNQGTVLEPARNKLLKELFGESLYPDFKYEKKILLEYRTKLANKVVTH